jgi:mannose-6-phosphate isomerase-like protein (cupin superfamily)
MARKQTVRRDKRAPAASRRERSIQTFQYATPKPSSASRTIVELCHGEHLRGEVHVMRAGSGSGIRHNPAADELWFVLRGQAQAIGPGRTLLGEFAAGDGLLMPRETRYRLLNVGGGDLELLLVGAAGVQQEAIEADPDEWATDPVERMSGRVL